MLRRSCHIRLESFLNWKNAVNGRQKSNGETYTTTEKAKMCLSDATFQGLLMTTKSFIGILDYMLGLGAEYVIFLRISQDVLESFFGTNSSKRWKQ
uniref:Uncharacterized protein n=1 Tax=Ciona intestinalis TaxID=7719 RepID=H2XNE4_CIOIN